MQTNKNDVTEEDCERAVAATLQLLTLGGKVTNRALSHATGVDEDFAIKFFGLAGARGALVQRGSASATKYVRPDQSA